jgi:tripartite-type tricarboxylate transporter receptor subunit TctC
MQVLHSFAVCFAVIAGVAAGAAQAQNFPVRPIRIVVPFPPGGSPDANARALGKFLHASLGQAIVVDNRSGADGIIGTDHVAKAPPSGYTYLFVGQTLVTNDLLNDNLPYNLKRDLVPVTQFAQSDGYVIAAHPSLKANNVAELVALTKAGGREVRYGTPGVGTSQNLAGELFVALSGARLVHIPYRGLGPAVNALLGGDELQLGFIPMIVVAAHISGGKLKAIANTATARWKNWPDIPTVAETIPGFAFSGGWHGIFAPAKTPPEIINRMQQEVRKALQAPEMRDYLAANGYVPIGSTPAEWAKFLEADTVRWADIIRIAKVPKKTVN